MTTAQDSAVATLTLMLRFYGIPADYDQLHHRLGRRKIDAGLLVRAAREHGLKAQMRAVTRRRLDKLPLPAVIRTRDGGFRILAKVFPDGVLLHDALAGEPVSLSRADFYALWDRNVILMTRRAKLSHPNRRFGLSWFMGAMFKYRRLLGEVLMASFFLQIFSLITPLFFQVIIDKVLVHRGLTTLDVILVGLVAVSGFESLLSGLRTHIFAHTTNRIDVELGARLFKHLLALPIAYFEARRTGDSVARVRELENIRNFLTSSSLTLVVDLVFTGVFLAVMFYYSPFLSWIVVGSLPFYVLISLVLTPLFRNRLQDKFDKGAENQSFLVESISGIHTLKSMAIEPQMQIRWEEQLAGYVSASFRVVTLSNSASQLVQLISKLVTAAVLYFGAQAVINGSMTVGELVAFNMLSGRVAQPVLRLAQVWQDFHQARVSVQRLGDILNAVPEPAMSPGSVSLPAISGAINFDNVSFRYRPDGRPVLDSISLDVKPGQLVGIVGPSGSGKSTLTKLVQRLYVPESGRVLIDGIDIGTIDASWLRRQVGVVLQENVLFNGTIRDNIALTDLAQPMDKVIEAAALAGAHDFISELPRGYDTVVGERGGSLSGGQRQRIAIARALMGDPRILIFDEATSALDYESERIIQDNMRNIAQRRTVLVIAHRLSTVRRADRIVTLDKGRLVEDGRHEDLIRKGGRYANLHRLQAGINELA